MPETAAPAAVAALATALTDDFQRLDGRIAAVGDDLRDDLDDKVEAVNDRVETVSGKVDSVSERVVTVQTAGVEGRADLAVAIERVRSEQTVMENRLIRWVVGTMIAGFTLLLSVLFGVLTARADAQALPVEAAELCENKPDEPDISCWEALEHPPGCRFWGDSLRARRATVSWTGTCSDGVAQGAGTLTSQPLKRKKKLWRADKKLLGDHYGLRFSLAEVQGRFRWTRSVQYPPYVNGQWHGTEVERYADGRVTETPWVNGELHGTAVWRYADGDVQETSWVNGKRHGTEVWRSADGDVQATPWVNGKPHGTAVRRSADGDVWETPYVDGKPHGTAVRRYADGRVQEIPYVNGEWHGTAVWRYADGRVTETVWVDGEPGLTVEVQRASKQPEQPKERRGRWGRIAVGVLGGAAIADAGDLSEAAVEAGIEFAKKVIEDGDAAAAASSQGLAGESDSPFTGNAPMSGGTASCEIPGLTDGTLDVQSMDTDTLGLSWCPASVGIQRRAFALQAEAIRCRLGVSDPPLPNAAEAREALRQTCERLAILNDRAMNASGGFSRDLAGGTAAGSGESCQCPAGFYQ